LIVGFIGTGTITSCVISGLLGTESPVNSIVVSPRNADRAAYLAKKFPKVSVAANNQSVINQSDILCIAVRPQVAEELLSELEFKENSTVVSFLSTYSLIDIRARVAPANRVFRMLPLPPVERGEGPVVIYPPALELQAVFKGIGELVQVESEDSLNKLLAVTAIMAPYFGFLNSVSQWLKDHDLPAQQADTFTGTLFHALSVTALSVEGKGFSDLTVEHATPGGLNEQLLRELAGNNWLNLPTSGLDLILNRLQGRATLNDKLPQHLNGENNVT